MKVFPLDAPPAIPGIYALRNSKAGLVYVGKTTDLLRRITEWRCAARGGQTNPNCLARDWFTDYSIEDWEFVVFREMPGATQTELTIAEEKAIRAARRKFGGNLLNADVAPPTQRTGRRGCLNPTLSTITYQAKEISYAEARELLGSGVKTLQKRLAKYRAKGLTTVSVETLLSRGMGSAKRNMQM